MAKGLQEDLIQDLETLHNDHDSADLEFVAGSNGGKVERIRAHRLIVLFRCRRYWNKKQQWLASRLPVMTVRLEWTEADTARRVVRYLYTGQVSLQALYRFAATCTAMAALLAYKFHELHLLLCSNTPVCVLS